MPERKNINIVINEYGDFKYVKKQWNLLRKNIYYVSYVLMKLYFKKNLSKPFKEIIVKFNNFV